MSGRIFTLGTSTNPIVQAIYMLLGGLVLIGAVLMGAVILAFVIGLVLVFGAIVWARVWWLRRKFLKSRGTQPSTSTQDRSDSSQRSVIEVEYTVVDERKPGEDKHE